MRASSVRQTGDEDVFSVDEIARASGVAPTQVVRLLSQSRGRSHGGFVRRPDAIRLVRALSVRTRPTGTSRAPLTLLTDTPRRQGLPLLVSGACHTAFVLALVLLTSGVFEARDTEQLVEMPHPARLVFLMAVGPGGGGGGGGSKVPLPAARAERKAPPKVVKTSSPTPPVRKPPPRPPKPAEPPKIDPPPAEPPRIDPPKPEPPKVDPPKPPAPRVDAPVTPRPADEATRPGVVDEPVAKVASAGPGRRGGTGNGAGTGMGAGQGTGLQRGSGSGTGGGPLRPGAGIEPPTLLREVKPLYTDEARRRSLEGDVVLEVVVRRDGSVGQLRVLRHLGAGLDERALEAVRQWRFAPARRYGSPVDVVVEVSVEFTLR